MKRCYLCGEEKPPELMNRSGLCAACHAERSAIYYRRSQGRYNEVRRAYRARVRAAVLQKYGGACACCGEDEPRFLGIDHINGGGAAERRVSFGYALYLRLYKGERRADLQVLCHNCNFAKGMYGQCPHIEAMEQAG